SLPNVGNITLTAHIWPPNSTSPHFKLGRRRPTSMQGIYFYRNRRLIQAGGWHGFLRDSVPDLILARVSLVLPSGLDGIGTVSKASVQIDAAIAEALAAAKSDDSTLETFVEDAREVLRKAAPQTASYDELPAVLKNGVNAKARHSANTSLTNGARYTRP